MPLISSAIQQKMEGAIIHDLSVHKYGGKVGKEKILATPKHAITCLPYFCVYLPICIFLS